MRRVYAAVAAVLALSACSAFGGADASVSPTVGDISQIEVGQSDTLAPSMTWPQGATFSSNQAEVMWQGDGAALQDGQPLLLDTYVVSLEDGTVERDTFNGLPYSTLLAPELLGDALYNVLLHGRVGTRVLVVAPREDEPGGAPAIAAVVDVLPDRAVGTTLEPNPELPYVTTLGSGEPIIHVDADKDLPAALAVSTLVRGDGPQIVPGSFIVAQFKAVYTSDGSNASGSWKAGDVRQSTWPPERAPFEGIVGDGRLPRAWDEGLLDQTSGSRVLLVAPPEWGYPGEGTLVYVVDILDVWNPAPEDDIPELPSASASPSPTPTAVTP